MPRHKKPPGTAVDSRNGQRDALVDEPVSGALAPFDPPAGLCDAAYEAWRDFWADRPALLMTPASRTVLRRWIDALDRYLRMTADADKEPISHGSTGQPIINPLYKVAEQARSVMEACERQLGIGGLNASSLGLAAIQERKSLHELNKSYGGPNDNGNPSEDDDDPRIVSGVRLETSN
jgi:phage terminase small subunit